MLKPRKLENRHTAANEFGASHNPPSIFLSDPSSVTRFSSKQNLRGCQRKTDKQKRYGTPQEKSFSPDNLAFSRRVHFSATESKLLPGGFVI